MYLYSFLTLPLEYFLNLQCGCLLYVCSTWKGCIWYRGCCPGRFRVRGSKCSRYLCNCWIFLWEFTLKISHFAWIWFLVSLLPCWYFWALPLDILDFQCLVCCHLCSYFCYSFWNVGIFLICMQLNIHAGISFTFTFYSHIGDLRVPSIGIFGGPVIGIGSHMNQKGR